MVSMGIPGFSYAESKEPESQENGVVETVDEFTDLVVPEDEYGTPDSVNDSENDELLMQYIDKNVDAETGRGTTFRKRAVASNRRSKLSDYDRTIYDAIRTEVDKIAAGERDDSMLRIPMKDLLQGYLTPINSSGYLWMITSDSLGVERIYEYKMLDNGEMGYVLSEEAKAKFFNAPAIVSALSVDMPQSLYWFDKTIGYSYGLNAHVGNGGKTAYFMEDPCLKINFTVSKDYSKSGGVKTYELNTTKTASAAECIENVSNIINENSDKGDYEKLLAYMNKICSLTSYNTAAANDPGIEYGDPWQMIYVFDGKSDTNVVCEGYAKAFQYLCDKSDFVDDGIECHTVTGVTSGLHMWNIVRMDDGRYYIADITNCDSGSTGNPNYLFMRGCKSGDVYNGYTYKRNSINITYTYDKGTMALYTEEELSNPSIGYLDYKAIDSWEDPEYEWAEDLTIVTATRTGKLSTDPSKEFTDREVRHTVTEVRMPATCTEEGVGAHIAGFFYTGFEEQEETFAISKTGHLWDGGVVTAPAREGIEGVRTFTCGRCAQKRPEVIPAIVYATDLPAVKISKPKAGKRKMTVRWKKVSKKNQKKIQGIEIQIATDPGFTNIVKTTIAGKKKASKAIKGLQTKTNYYVRVRAYNNAADGKHVSVWKSKSAKVK